MVNGLVGSTIQMHTNYRQAVAFFREMGDQQGLSAAVVGLGITPGYMTMPVSAEPDMPMEEAAAYFAEALAIAQNIGWRSGEAYQMALHSGHLQTSGQYQQALQVSEQAIRIAREIEHHQWIILASFQLGYVYLDLFL